MKGIFTRDRAVRPDVGLIGLGIMGSAMSSRLLAAGYRVVGYDLLARRRRGHRQAGGDAVSSCADVGRRVRLVICSLPSPGALLDTAGELAATMTRSGIVIETSTLPIAVKERARRVLAARGVTLLDCPLSGTGVQARAGDLVVYGSGDRAAYRRAVPIFRAFARAHYYVGPFGAASKMKFVANLLVAIHNVAAAEALLLARRVGLDGRRALEVLGDGAGSSRMLQVRGPLMVGRRYSKAMMKLDVWQKDMRIIADVARATQSPTPLFRATAPIYKAALAGGARRDTAAVYDVLERMVAKDRRM
jgi:3-hydroxyisobutyrate dehydrogenase-like beta-hydroxyacid dehydrogenase